MMFECCKNEGLIHKAIGYARNAQTYSQYKSFSITMIKLNLDIKGNTKKYLHIYLDL